MAARTILHLGRELITSDEIAINELVKNAFDAGSPNADVDDRLPGSSFRSSKPDPDGQG
ncbi:hypothetical protein [Stenotrophomonas sp. WZN-1]|uniref:hypothetical protein n=1 Tax=Stenotrophomonas sp. WZN-1 TaxID=2005046 RepID=UPI0018DF916A|nr:hypothetical protein [Stenotrophomonas sp. WZN-1]